MFVILVGGTFLNHILKVPTGVVCALEGGGVMVKFRVFCI